MGAACVFLVGLVALPSANAQRFLTPTGDSADTARSQHIEAIRAQMYRAARETGADAEFAEKAFLAQQQYLARQEQRQYGGQRSVPAPASHYRTPTKQQVAQTPGTYSPPVHVTPDSATVSAPSVQRYQKRLAQRENDSRQSSLASRHRISNASPTPAADRPSLHQAEPLEYFAPAQQVAYRTEPAPTPAPPRQTNQYRQTALVEPVQDPFNDRSASTRLPSRLRRQPAVASRREPVVPQKNEPAKQISVLLKQPGGATPQGSDTRPPIAGPRSSSPATTSLGSSTRRSALPQDTDASQDFQRPTSRQDNRGSGQDDLDPSKIEDLVEQLEKDVKKSRDEILDNDLRSDLDDDTNSDSDEKGRSRESRQRSCQDFSRELLSSSIRDISLDISPPPSVNRGQAAAISRSWSDRSGNVIATGTMVDLRRGYVIIDGLEGRQKLAYAKLSDADWLAISEYWDLPELCSLGNQYAAPRNWVPQTYTWKASSLCHKPLFFEDIQLERYGHSHGPFRQPVVSVAHFFVSLTTIYYQSAITPANECQYALGFYRPGSCAPWLRDPIPLSLAGARRQALATTGLAFIP